MTISCLYKLHVGSIHASEDLEITGIQTKWKVELTLSDVVHKHKCEPCNLAGRISRYFLHLLNRSNKTLVIYFTEYAQLFAALIARTAKDIDVLIDSLPSEESTAALQVRQATEPMEGALYADVTQMKMLSFAGCFC